MAGSALQGKHAPAPATDLPGYLPMPGICPCQAHAPDHSKPFHAPATAPAYAHDRLLHLSMPA